MANYTYRVSDSKVENGKMRVFFTFTNVDKGIDLMPESALFEPSSSVLTVSMWAVNRVKELAQIIEVEPIKEPEHIDYDAIEEEIRCDKARLLAIPEPPTNAELLIWAEAHYPHVNYSAEKAFLEERIIRNENILNNK